MAQFESWSHENLVKFCKESASKLAEQEQQIEVMQSDIRMLLNQLRKGITHEHAARKTD